MENQINVLCNTSSYNYSGYPKSINLIKNPQKRRLTREELDQMISAFDPVGIIAGVEPINNETLKTAKSLKVSDEIHLLFSAYCTGFFSAIPK